MILLLHLAGPNGVHLVDLVLLALAIETLALLLHHTRTGRGLPPADLPGLLGAGLFLALALRFALTGAALHLIAACLALAGIAHLVDLRRRWR
jgi:hypothetical protein